MGQHIADQLDGPSGPKRPSKPDSADTPKGQVVSRRKSAPDATDALKAPGGPNTQNVRPTRKTRLTRRIRPSEKDRQAGRSDQTRQSPQLLSVGLLSTCPPYTPRFSRTVAPAPVLLRPLLLALLSAAVKMSPLATSAITPLTVSLRNILLPRPPCFFCYFQSEKVKQAVHAEDNCPRQTTAQGGSAWLPQVKPTKTT